MADKEKSKTDLVSQGRALMKVSNEVRASDIEQKIQRLEDKWEHLKAVIAFRWANQFNKKTAIFLHARCIDSKECIFGMKMRLNLVKTIL